MDSPEGKMKVKEGVRGRVTSISGRFKAVFITDDTSGRIYASSDPETVLRVASVMANTQSPVFVNFTSMRIGACALAVNIVLEEARNPVASPNSAQCVQGQAKPVAGEEARKGFPSVAPLKTCLPDPQISNAGQPSPSIPETVSTNPAWPPPPPSCSSTASTYTAHPSRNLFEQPVPTPAANGPRQPSGFGGMQPAAAPLSAFQLKAVGVPARAPLQPALDRGDVTRKEVLDPSVLEAPRETPFGRIREPLVSATSSSLPVTPSRDVHRYDAFNVACDQPPLASSNREFATPSPQQVPQAIPSNDSRFAMGTTDDLHILLNKWYCNPASFNRDEYPFPCGGFVVQAYDNNIMIFTRRLGFITRKDDPARKGRPFAYFMVCGPDNYQAWEYDESQPPAFKSTKFVNSKEIEMKGYALMAPGKRNDPESCWSAWNDHTGLMRCQSSSARILKKKYANWEPTAQMVMFDAVSVNNGKSWMIKTLSYIDYQFTEAQGAWPKQAYFVDDLRVLPMEKQRNPKGEIWMYSETIGDEVVAPIEHIRFLPTSERLQFETIYGAVIVPLWGNNGLCRRLQCLMTAPECMWKDRKLRSYVELSQALMIRDWNTDVENGTPNHCSPTLEAHFKPKPHGF